MTMQMLYTVPEVAQQLRVSRRTIERLIAAGRIRATRVGSRTLVTDKEIAAFVASSTKRRAA